MSIFYIECPYCKGIVEIHEKEINCAIFRHGIYKISGAQMNPHSSKEECDKAFDEDRIIGCGKPFRIIVNDKKFIAEICDYI